MPSRPPEPLCYDPRGVLLDATGISAQDLADLAPALEAARQEVLADLELWHSPLWQDGETSLPEKQPLDTGFIDLPQRLLADYQRDRGRSDNRSELGRILSTAQRLIEQVDCVVVLGVGGSYLGAHALSSACCHPYHNELSRGERGGRPRIYFDGNNLDNDSTQGLLDLLSREHMAGGIEDRWGIVVVSKSGNTLETAVALRQFLAALGRSCVDDANRLAELVVPITGSGGPLFELATALGCRDVFAVPDGVGGRFSVLSAVGLLPAALLGLDVIKLLTGAAAMTDRFREAPPGENPVLDYVAVCHLMERLRGAHVRVLSVWSKALEAFGFWYDQLLSESLGKQLQGATPVTAVNTRDLHSRGQQHQQGRRDKLITNLIVDHPRRDRLTVGRSNFDQDQLNALADKTWPDIMQAALTATTLACQEDQRPCAELHVPRLDEASLGQLFQMLMLATAVEGRLIGVNPYGQPGVESYKRHMNSILRGAS